MGMPSGFGSPNPASFGANFPSPALSQGSFGGVPSSSGSYAQNALQMQQMQQMMSGLGIHQGALAEASLSELSLTPVTRQVQPA